MCNANKNNDASSFFVWRESGILLIRVATLNEHSGSLPSLSCFIPFRLDNMLSMSLFRLIVIELYFNPFDRQR